MPEPDVKSFTTFGELLKHLRHRARLTQDELGIAVGYARAHIARLEGSQRVPNVTSVKARFLNALDLEPESDAALRLIELATLASETGDHAEHGLKLDQVHPRPNNLPYQLTSFIGRKQALAELQRLADSNRLLTLTGTGGVGKTRLALALATLQLHHYLDGVWFVELASVTDVAAVPTAVLHTLGLSGQRDAEALSALVDVLRGKAMLLILDNCEHVVSACAQLAEIVLRECGKVCIVATSREVLGIAGEQVWRVPSMQTTSNATAEWSELAQCESVQLFVERAKSVSPEFCLTQANAPFVLQICSRLDGIPLAIELAAARVSVLSPQQIAERLDDRFRLLANAYRTLLPRHQTLQAMIDWSYRLLTESERHLFRCLAVFAGGWTLEAAEAVCADVGSGTNIVLEQLTHLVDQSLVNVNDAGAERRYTFLETIHQYAAARLAETGEGPEVRSRHLDYYLKFGKRVAYPLNHDHSSDQARVIRQLDRDMANIKQALGWAIQNQRVEDGYALLQDYYVLFIARMGRGPEFLGMFSALLAPPAGAQSTHVNALVHLELGDLNLHLGRLDQTKWHYERAREIGLAIDNADVLVKVEYGCAWHAILCNDGKQARLHHAAWKQFLQRADKLLVEEMADGELGFRYELADLEGDYATERTVAVQCYERAHQFLTKMQTSAHARMLGYALIGTGEFALAHERLRESLLDNHTLGDKQAVAACLSAFAALALAQHSLVRCARLYGASEAAQKSIHVTLVDWDRRRAERNICKLRQLLDSALLCAAWAEGGAMSIDQAMTYALDPSMDAQ